MLYTWKEIPFEQKLKRIFIAVAVIILVLLILFNWSIPNFLLYVLVMASVYPSQNHYQKKRLKEINYMWHLVKEFNISLITLSQVTNIGTIDLEATKLEGNGVYLPPRKNILQGIEYLETLKK